MTQRKTTLFTAALGILVLTASFAAPAFAQATKNASGLPLPRFVSLKAKKINLRVGPGKDYAVSWLYLKTGLPVEIIQEYDNWRRIRDADGAEGWVFHSMLSGERSAIAAPWMKSKGDVFVNMRADGRDTWVLDGEPFYDIGATATAGWPDPFPAWPPTYDDMHPAAHDAHARLAHNAGISQGIIDAIHRGEKPKTMDPQEEAIWQFAHELLQTKRVSEATFARARQLFGQHGVVDLVGVMGYYTLVSMTLNTFQVPLPDGETPPFAE